ncbi:MAG: hypothetical protein ACM3OA_13125 [Acidobacteriota bacterium]
MHGGANEEVLRMLDP